MRSRTAFIIIILLGAIAFASCRGSGASRAQKQAYKAEKQAQKDSEKAIAEFHEHQYEIQADETKKMIKETKKRNKKLNKSKRDPFFKRVFGKKAPGCK